ncbi:hypothetical protein Purlil1_13528 [Purpureocillium lilacinum]|uniref:Uncharacterized protein n=1 Tax=Purpureocillium lilacinum TaxID=33203 RepID=A0ABR0BDS8_PURLI|nr:hypothetical protein Purlil1_13528 [Purpureocillium lilacinum]
MSEDMEKAIETLATEKIGELLALCGVSNYCDDESTKQRIRDVVAFVREIQRRDGVETIPALSSQCIGSEYPVPIGGLRGSYRLAAKRGRAQYKGQAGPSRRVKSKKVKSGRASNTIANPDEALSTAEQEPSVVVTASTQTDKTSAEGDRSADPAEEPTNVAPPPPRDEPASSTTTRAALSSINSNTASSNKASPPSGEGEIPTNSLAASGDSQTENPVPGYPGSESRTGDTREALDSPTAIKAIESILLDCVRLTYALGRYQHRSWWDVQVTTKLRKIREFVTEFAKLDYDTALKAIKRENAIFAGKNIQTRYVESIYWDIIQKGAKLLDPTTLPIARGPLDEFSMAEKVATKKFMTQAGYATSTPNQRRCRRFWKSLSDMRKAGVDKMLCYRTRDFDSFCSHYPVGATISLVDTVLSWEKLYGPHIEQLEDRAFRESQNDWSGTLWLNQPVVSERLEVSITSWDNAKNRWHSAPEQRYYNTVYGPDQASCDQLGGLLDISTTSGGSRNKSIFTSILPGEKPPLTICSIFTIQEGDYLGIFAGELRFTDEVDARYGIPGPKAHFWLDYSRITGVLNQMCVLPPDGDANVALQWELFWEGDEKDKPPSWRVAVRATRTIKPFEELRRCAPSIEQYHRHQQVAHARKGFLREEDTNSQQ